MYSMKEACEPLQKQRERYVGVRLIEKRIAAGGNCTTVRRKPASPFRSTGAGRAGSSSLLAILNERFEQPVSSSLAYDELIHHHHIMYVMQYSHARKQSNDRCWAILNASRTSCRSPLLPAGCYLIFCVILLSCNINIPSGARQHQISQTV